MTHYYPDLRCHLVGKWAQKAIGGFARGCRLLEQVNIHLLFIFPKQKAAGMGSTNPVALSAHEFWR